MQNLSLKSYRLFQYLKRLDKKKNEQNKTMHFFFSISYHFSLAKRIGFLLLSAAIILTGCTSSLWNRTPPPSSSATGAVIGAVGGAAVAGIPGVVVGGGQLGIIGKAFDQKRTLVENLEYNGVQVIRVGHKIKMILPTDRFFHPESETLNPAYYPVLDQIVALIKIFPKINVEVSGYTDCVGPWQRNLALSKRQAIAITDYLWHADIDARLIYAEGYGQAYPIATNGTPRGRALNRRIEIVFYILDP